MRDRGEPILFRAPCAATLLECARGSHGQDPQKRDRVKRIHRTTKSVATLPKLVCRGTATSGDLDAGGDDIGNG